MMWPSTETKGTDMTAYDPDNDGDVGGTTAPPRRMLSGTAAAVALALLVLAGVAGGLWLWLAADDDSAGPEIGVTVEDVAEDRFADVLVGEEVTISGELTAWLIPGRAFWIGSDGVIGDNVLIVIDSPVEGLDDDTVVRATGVVADFDAVALLDELDETDVGADFGPYEDQNVVLADEVTILGVDS